MNNFCIAHASFSAIETFQERHLQELGAFILSSIFLCLPNVVVERFWWMENMLLRTPCVRAADICGVYMILIWGA